MVHIKFKIDERARNASIDERHLVGREIADQPLHASWIEPVVCVRLIVDNTRRDVVQGWSIAATVLNKAVVDVSTGEGPVVRQDLHSEAHNKEIVEQNLVLAEDILHSRQTIGNVAKYWLRVESIIFGQHGQGERLS